MHQQQNSHLKAQLQQLFSFKTYPEEMKEIWEFLQQIVNEACDEKSLPSGQWTDKAELTVLCPFLFPSDLNKDTPQPAQKNHKQNNNNNNYKKPDKTPRN